MDGTSEWCNPTFLQTCCCQWPHNFPEILGSKVAHEAKANPNLVWQPRITILIVLLVAIYKERVKRCQLVVGFFQISGMD